jgi:hypothetical protein
MQENRGTSPSCVPGAGARRASASLDDSVAETVASRDTDHVRVPKEHRIAVVVAVLALIAAAPAVLGALGVRNVWLLIGVTVVAAAATGIAVVWQERYKRAAERRDEMSTKIEEGCLVLPSGKLPRVRDITDPVMLGTHPSTAVGADPSTKAPAYVLRDTDAALRTQLEHSGFVLLVGDSTAGKSRAAREAMTATLPDHLLIAPAHRDALPAAIAAAVAARRCVLWLDDLERFLGVGGMSRVQVARLLSGVDDHRVVIATLRGAEERRFTERAPAADDAAKTATDMARDTLAQVTCRLRLDRRFTVAEQERAQALTRDSRIVEALRHADEYGIAEYLACGPELQRDLDNAWEPGANPRGAALVAAAVDVRRSGYLDPPPKELLEKLHEIYLRARGGDRLQPEPLAEAWTWAARRRRATAALLQPTSSGDAVAVFDYVVDEVQRRNTELAPDEVISTVLGYARPTLTTLATSRA